MAKESTLLPGRPKTPKTKSKTFTGCFTCRSRKIRCDLARPECRNCKKNGLKCAGYDIKLRWLLPGQFNFNKRGPVQATVVFPQVKDSDEEFFQRRNVGFVVWEKPYDTYDQMDSDLNSLHGEGKDEIRLKGPFGVFAGTVQASRPRRRPHSATAGHSHISSTASHSHISTAGKHISTASHSHVSTGHSHIPTTGHSLISPAGHSHISSQMSHKSPASAASPSPKSTPGIPEPDVGHDQLWLSNELRDHALLTAAALNGDTQFLDFVDLPAINYNPESQDLLNLVFHRHSHPQLASVAHEPKAPAEPVNLPNSDLVAINPANQHLFYSNYNNFYYNNPYQLNETLDIQLHASLHALKQDDEATDMVEGDQGTTRMPDDIMLIVQSPLQPKLGFDISLLKNGVMLPTTALQVQPLTRYLLNYYVAQVADLMTVIPLTENPWKTIYFPRALMAIGELCALGKTSTAKNALLNALLAVAAFNLQSKFPKNSAAMKFYLNLGIRLRNQASLFVKTLLGSKSETQSNIERCVASEKYKDVLCAVMSMISVDLVWGTMQDTNFYIKWCEKVIYTKMTNKKKLSSKARILHRIFLSLRLIQDSTCLDFVNIKDDYDMAAQFGYDVRSRFDADTHSSKGKIEYIVDHSRTSPMFVNKKLINTNKNDANFATDALYGLPNSLISLFSETVLLLREKIYHREMYRTTPPNFEELVSGLGAKLQNWKLDWKLVGEDKQFFSLMHEATYHHIMSFYHALTIYFNRLIRDTPPHEIQDKVAQTLEHLNLIQQLIAKDEAHIIPLFWQGFIAGCEAVSLNLQMGFKKWGADIAQYLGSYWGARQIMLEVWRRKKMKEARDDWVSVIQDWEMNLMLN